MRYETIRDLPGTLRDVLPEGAQRLYLETFQRVWDDYETYQGGEMDRHLVAHREAMHAVEDAYVLDKVSNNWVPREDGDLEEAEVTPVNVQPGNQV